MYANHSIQWLVCFHRPVNVNCDRCPCLDYFLTKFLYESLLLLFLFYGTRSQILGLAHAAHFSIHLSGCAEQWAGAPDLSSAMRLF